ncbi:MAG: glutamate--cysteine ligase [Bacteriovoracaceae bacterium]
MSEKQYQIKTKEDFFQFVCDNWKSLNQYIDDKLPLEHTPIYTSVDIRESATKIAPIDNNLYPAGFNNVCQLDLDSASQNFSDFIERIKPETKSILLIPESHTKNLFYLDHLVFLKKALSDAGFDVTFGSPNKDLFESSQSHLELISHSKLSIDLHLTDIKDGEFTIDGKTFDLVVLNNDQSSPLNLPWPEIKTPVHPSPLMGWTKRMKHTHFLHYKEVVDEFSEKFSINPDILQAKFRMGHDINFTEKSGFEKIASEAKELWADLPSETTLFIKASQGTYGMGIMVAKNEEEILNMNKKTRHKMNAGKNALKFTSVIIQEGIETILQYENMPAEIAIYLVGGKSVGGFMRTNTKKDNISNLNSQGMVFRKFCISELKGGQDHTIKEAAYSLVARLSTLAAAKEVEEMKKENL